jgi:L-aspartate oxidase
MPEHALRAEDTDPLIVVGSGIAGALLALRAADRRPVVLVTKGELGAGSTRAAQGGFSAAIAPDDSPELHAADTLAAGAGLCDPAAVRRICAEGPARIAELAERGVRFDREGGALALAREGAHSAARVVHAGGDATGAHISAALVAEVRAHPLIEVAEHEDALDVVIRDGRAAGLRTRDAAGRERVRAASAIALAAGGAGHLFLHTTNPLGATADGPALAARAGAALADLEMVQFHPTALALGASPLPLVSEAVRGEGAYLRDAAGRRFMLDLHPMAELGPRDVVARAIARQAAHDGVPVRLDLRHLDPELVLRRFPTIAASCAAHGLDLARDLIPVTPAAHYAIGGVLADLAGRTTVPGLFAIGECASTGVHGANRLASNSLLEGAVMAVEAAAALAAGIGEWPAPAGLPAGPARRAPAPAGPSADPALVRAAIQRTMWGDVGVERDADGLADARRTLAAIPPCADPETESLREIALATAVAAELRTESRGAHFRRDHPDADPAQARRVAWIAGVPHPLEPAARRRRALAAKEAA